MHGTELCIKYFKHSLILGRMQNTLFWGKEFTNGLKLFSNESMFLFGELEQFSLWSKKSRLVSVGV